MFLGKKRVLKVPSQYSQQNHFIRSQNLPQKKLRRVFLGEKRVLKVPSQFVRPQNTFGVRISEKQVVHQVRRRLGFRMGGVWPKSDIPPPSYSGFNVYYPTETLGFWCKNWLGTFKTRFLAKNARRSFFCGSLCDLIKWFCWEYLFGTFKTRFLPKNACRSFFCGNVSRLFVQLLV